jgi:hypothetical protein
MLCERIRVAGIMRKRGRIVQLVAHVSNCLRCASLTSTCAATLVSSPSSDIPGARQSPYRLRYPLAGACAACRVPPPVRPPDGASATRNRQKAVQAASAAHPAGRCGQGGGSLQTLLPCCSYLSTSRPHDLSPGMATSPRELKLRAARKPGWREACRIMDTNDGRLRRRSRAWRFSVRPEANNECRLRHVSRANAGLGDTQAVVRLVASKRFQSPQRARASPPRMLESVRVLGKGPIAAQAHERSAI